MESVSGLNNREVERNASLASRRSSCLEQFSGGQVSADVTDHRCTELGGKLIGQPTIILRRKYKFDPYDDSSLPLGGSGDKSKRGWTSRAWHATKRVLVSPVRFYIEAAYLSRPSITSKEARANEWAALHSPHRYILSILVGFGPPGYFFWNVRYPLAITTLLTVANCIYETFHAVYPALPEFANTTIWDVFRSGTFVLSIVIGMKINQVYQRYWLARQSYGTLCGNLNALAQLMHLYAAESSLTAAEIDGYLDEIYRYCVVYTYAVIMQLLTLDHLPREARHLVSPEEIAMLESTKKPRKFVHFRLQELVLKFRLKTEHYIAIQNLLTAAEVNAATCRRIKFFPLPFGLSLVATGFVMIWCLLIPFGIPEPTRDDGLAGQISSTWLTGLCVFILNAMLLVIDEAANQLEDPYHFIPLFDATKTAMGHLSIVKQDYNTMRNATGGARERERVTSTSAD